MAIELGMMPARRRSLAGAASALVVVLWFAGPVIADGDDFFTFRSRLFNDNGGRGEVDIGFVGNVRDDRGNRLGDATLTVAVNAHTDEGVQRVTFTAYTDVLGRYRTLDAAGAVSDLLGIEVFLAPEDVELMGVEKEGYLQVRRMARGTSGKKTILEIDFVMKKID